MTSILLVGASGLVGGLTLDLLLADPRITRVIAPTRRSLPPRPGLENPVVDFDHLDPDAAWWRVDGAICALGTTRATAGSAAAFRKVDHDYVLAIAQCVRNGGVGRFALVSSLGADANSRMLYPRTKGEIEDAVRQLEFASLTIVRPSLLTGPRATIRPAEKVAELVMKAVSPLLPRLLRPTPASKVADLLVESVLAARPGTHVINASD